MLEHHPGIADVAIVAGQGPGRGGVRVGRGEETPGLDELPEFCRDKIGGYKIPKCKRLYKSISGNATLL